MDSETPLVERESQERRDKFVVLCYEFSRGGLAVGFGYALAQMSAVNMGTLSGFDKAFENDLSLGCVTLILVLSITMNILYSQRDWTISIRERGAIKTRARWRWPLLFIFGVVVAVAQDWGK